MPAVAYQDDLALAINIRQGSPPDHDPITLSD
jgi:hypothetical protein